MGLVRNTMFVLIALFIDGLQAAVSWGIAIIAAVPGTALGGAAGCAAGDYIAGGIGCAVGGFVLGLLGTTGNALLAPFTIPIGIAMGLAVNTTLSIVLGWAFLVPLMFFFGIRPHRQLPWGLGEVVPGINNVPFWTFLTIATLWANARQKSAASKHNVMRVASRALAPVQDMMDFKKKYMEQPRISGALQASGYAQEQVDTPESGEDLVRTADRLMALQDRRRMTLQGIRSTKPHAQAI